MDRDQLEAHIRDLSEAAMTSGEVQIGELLSRIFICMNDPAALAILHQGTSVAYRDALLAAAARREAQDR